jgi:hypothetical protein
MRVLRRAVVGVVVVVVTLLVPTGRVFAVDVTGPSPSGGPGGALTR